MTDHLTGPWVAVLADREGYVYESFTHAVEELGAEHDEEMRVCVVRGSAAPAERWGNLCMPGSYNSGDMVFDIDPWLVDPDDDSVGAEARYAQAQAMAAGLNAAAAEVAR